MNMHWDRRRILKSGSAAAMVGGLAATMPRATALAADEVPVRLWLQAQWWTDDYAAACAKATGVEIHNTTTISNPTTFSKLMAGGGRDADCVQIGGPFIPELVEAGLLQPLDMKQIPNASAVYPDFQRPDYLFGKDGKQYGVAFVWGYDSLLYNADMVEPSDSLGVLYSDKYKGHIGLRDDAFFGLSTAALYLRKEHPFALAGKDLQEVKNFLISKKPIFRTFWSSFADCVTLMKNRDIWATAGWLPIYWVLKRVEHMNVRYPVPKEGAPGWNACFVIPKEARSVDAVHRFVNWMLSPGWTVPIATDKGYYAASRLGISEIPPDVRQAMNLDHVDELVKKLTWSSFPKNLQDWTEAWTEFKAA